MQRRHHKFLKEEIFAGQRYRKMEDQTSWPSLAVTQDFAEGKETER